MVPLPSRAFSPSSLPSCFFPSPLQRYLTHISFSLSYFLPIYFFYLCDLGWIWMDLGGSAALLDVLSSSSSSSLKSLLFLLLLLLLLLMLLFVRMLMILVTLSLALGVTLRLHSKWKGRASRRRAPCSVPSASTSTIAPYHLPLSSPPCSFASSSSSSFSYSFFVFCSFASPPSSFASSSIFTSVVSLALPPTV